MVKMTIENGNPENQLEERNTIVGSANTIATFISGELKSLSKAQILSASKQCKEWAGFQLVFMNGSDITVKAASSGPWSTWPDLVYQ